jgi:hypothetical protein
MAVFNIGIEFSTDPAGRYYSDGEFSGERFREEYLLPKLRALRNNEVLDIVIDDGVEAYGSSFISEGFAGIVKYGHMTSEELLKKIKISYSNTEFEFFEKRIKDHIKKSNYNSAEYKQ